MTIVDKTKSNIGVSYALQALEDGRRPVSDKENKMITFYLNGDGMTNIHPKKETIKSDRFSWYFEMPAKEFESYLNQHCLYVDGDNILDLDDDYLYGVVQR